MKKVYKKLSREQLKRGVVFSSTLSKYRFETSEDNIHEVFNSDSDKIDKIARLKDDKFYNQSHFKFNIIRT